MRTKPLHVKNPLVKQRSKKFRSDASLPKKIFMRNYHLSKTEGFVNPVLGDEPCDPERDSKQGPPSVYSSNLNTESLPGESIYKQKALQLRIQPFNHDQSIKIGDSVYGQISGLQASYIDGISSVRHNPKGDSMFKRFTQTNSQVVHQSSDTPASEEDPEREENNLAELYRNT